MNKQQAKKLEKSVLEKIPTEKLILGVSGGPDSIFLLNILKEHDLIAAHINHNIRKEAQKDQKFVEKMCKDLNVPLEVLDVDIQDLSKKSKRGLEETGRIKRYKFFEKLAKKHQAQIVVTAHHADDNLETILMNFVRGGGLKAISGMQNSKSLIRPLLHISKKDIIDYLNFNKIPYCTDQSNFDTKYTRNNLRQEIIPKLKKINPNIITTIAKNSENLMEIQDFLEQSAQNWIKKNTENKSFSAFPQKKFTKLHKALQKAILIELYKIHCDTLANLESVHITDAIALINNNIGAKHKKMGQVEISLKKGRITLKKTAKKSNINGLKFP